LVSINDAGTDDINEKIDDVRFLDDCTQYCNSSVDLRWDLDVSGTYETTGNTVAYNAATADDPSTISHAVRGNK
jgi:hypothetical protein